MIGRGRTPEENFALARREHEAGLIEVDSTPALLTIESTSICNLRCVMCPHAIDAVDRPKHMPEELIARLAVPLAMAREAQLHGIGEPLASPAFWRALESDAFHPDCVLNVNTNLTLLNDRRLRLLMGAKAELRLNISVDAATERTYSRIRGAEFGEILDNIRRLAAARGAGKRPVIGMNMTLMRENIEEAPEFVELAHELGADGVYLWQMNRWPDREMDRYLIDRAGWHFDYAEQGLWNFPELSDRCLREAQIRARSLGMPLNLEGFKDIFFGDPEPPSPPAAPARTEQAVSADPVRDRPAKPETVRDCRAPWEWALVSTNGDVRPCCFAPGAIGNLNEAPFAEIWNGSAMQTLRRDLLAGVVGPVCRGAACKYVKNSETTAGPGADPALPARPRRFAARLQRKLRLRIRSLLRPAWKRLPIAGRQRILKIWERIFTRG